MCTLLVIITWPFWLSPTVSTRDPIIKPESFSLRADNGRGLILRVMTKIPCYNITGVIQKVLPMLSTETLLHIWLSTSITGSDRAVRLSIRGTPGV